MFGTEDELLVGDYIMSEHAIFHPSCKNALVQFSQAAEEANRAIACGVIFWFYSTF